MLLAQMVVEYIADTSKLVNGVRSIADAQKAGAEAVQGFAKTTVEAAAVAGIALIGAGIAATKMAGEFESGITSLETGAGELHSNLAMVGEGIKKIAVDTGTSTKDLISAMFMIDSAGNKGADGLNVLRIAAEGAKTDHADLTTTTQALTGVMTNFKIPASGAAGAMNELIAASKAGKMHLQDLSGALGPIGEVAQNAGVKFADVGGAIAMMTNANVSARQASQNLAFAIRSIDAPSGVAVKSLASVGLKAQEVTDTLRNQGLPAALQLIEDHVGNKFPTSSIEWTTAMKNIMGGKAGLNVALAIGGENLKAYQKNVNDISGALKAGGTSVEGWSVVQGNFNTKMSQARETVEILGINMGSKLLPVVNQLLDKFNSPAFASFANTVAGVLSTALLGLVNVISNVVTTGSNLVNFFQHNQIALELLKIALIAAAGAIGGYLIGSFILAIPMMVAFAVAAWGALVPLLPFIAIGAAVALVIYGIVLAVQHWGQIVAWLSGVWGAFSGWFMGLMGSIGAWFQGVWKGIAAWFTGMWTGIISFLHTAWDTIVNVIKIGAMLAFTVLFLPIVLMVAAFVWLYNHNYYFKALVDAIVNFFRGCFEWCVGAWNGFTSWLVGAWNTTVHFASDLWGKVSGAIRTGFNASIAFVSDIWNKISSFFVNAWNTYVANPLHTLWTNVSSVFSSAWSTYISGPLGDLWTSFSTWVSNLATKFVEWGGNVIAGFIQGIKDKVAGIGTALAGAAETVKNFLGFHSPTKMGPGMDADQWAPNFVKMYAKGLTDNIPLIEVATSNLIKPVSLGIKGTGSSYAGGSSSGGGKQTIIIEDHTHHHLYIDGQRVSDVVGKRIVKELRRDGLKK